MPTIHVVGNINDITQTPMRTRNVRLWWQLNLPATTTDGFTLSTDRVYATISDSGATGVWGIDVFPTESMVQKDRWYLVGWDWLEDGPDEPPTGWDIYPGQIRVPERDVTFSEIVRDFTSPLDVWIGENEPTNKTPWWFKPSTNDLYHL